MLTNSAIGCRPTHDLIYVQSSIQNCLTISFTLSHRGFGRKSYSQPETVVVKILAIRPRDHMPIFLYRPSFCSGSVAEWLSCWTQAQKGLGSNRSRDAVG